MSNKKIKVWCFVNKKTGIPEPVEGMDNKNKGTRWWDGYGIFGTKAALLKNIWNNANNADGYSAKRIEIKFYD